jgi:hypothetical protein
MMTISGTNAATMVLCLSIFRSMNQTDNATRLWKILCAAEDDFQASVVIENHQGPLHLLITDVIMPGMSGMGIEGGISCWVPSATISVYT